MLDNSNDERPPDSLIDEFTDSIEGIESLAISINTGASFIPKHRQQNGTSITVVEHYRTFNIAARLVCRKG